jgi:Co/Zn/Cd efflux system component
MMRSEMSESAATSCGCGGDVAFDGLSRDYKTRLWAVIALNASMFAVEMGGGAMAGSQALQADALDFLGDTMTYGTFVVGTPCAEVGAGDRRPALAVWNTATGWLDVIVAAILASLFLNSAHKILRQALAEWRLTKNAHPAMGAARTNAP